MSDSIVSISEQKENSQSRRKNNRRRNRTTQIQMEFAQGIPILAWLILIGLLGSILFSFQANGFLRGATIFGIAFIISGASLLIGCLLGFLFGIPKTFRESVNDTAESTKNTSTNKEELKQSFVDYQPNTNLEEISDWLTKILVGVGLTQLVKIPEALEKFSEFAAIGLGNFESSKVFSIALLLFYLICGFLLSYLWTRLYFAGALHQADLEALINQEKYDKQAKKVFYQQLSPDLESKPVPQKEIVEKLKLASTDTREQIFYQTNNYLKPFLDNLKSGDKNTETIVARARPILVGLASNLDDTIHPAYQSQLAQVNKILGKEPTDLS